MSKRGEKYPRSPRDLYETIDPRAIPPLLRHVDKSIPFIEPCAGGGALVDQLVGAGLKLHYACDIVPLRDDIAACDAREVISLEGRRQFITNPPFVRALMHEIMIHCARQVPSWFLVEADWLMTKQASKILRTYGSEVVTIGRLKWFREGDPRDKGNEPMDNFVWLKLEPEPFGAMCFWPKL
jgi:hypothetical protein